MTKIDATLIAIVCATKNQPEKLERLIQSIVGQSLQPAQIIVCDAGSGNSKIRENYNSAINLLHLMSPFQGQVEQRKFAYRYLDKSIELVLNLDDDVTLERDAIERLADAWNKQLEKPGLPLGGMGLNVIDAIPPKKIFLRKFFLMSDTLGKVSCSGYCSSYVPANKSVNPEWLLGGSSAWRRDIIDTVQHPVDFPTRWAVYEDSIFSYLVGKKYSLSVASEACVKHNETYAFMPFQKALFYGKSMVVMRYFFVSLNRELSVTAFYWMSIMQIASYFLLGFVENKRFFGFCLGGVAGLILCLASGLGNGSAKTLAVNLYEK